MAATNRLDPLVRLAVLIRDGAVCQYCGARHSDGAPLQADHVIARSRGGSDDPSNLVTACRACNLDKAHLSLAVYVIHREEQGLPTAGLVERVRACLARPVNLEAARRALVDVRREATGGVSCAA